MSTTLINNKHNNKPLPYQFFKLYNGYLKRIYMKVQNNIPIISIGIYYVFFTLIIINICKDKKCLNIILFFKKLIYII